MPGNSPNLNSGKTEEAAVLERSYEDLYYRALHLHMTQFRLMEQNNTAVRSTGVIATHAKLLPSINYYN